MTEFEQMWNSEYAADFDDFIERYTVNYHVVKKQREISRKAEIPSLEGYWLQTNPMQAGFITNLLKSIVA